MTSFSHLWGCEWTPSKAALWHLLVVKTLWDARGGYRFRRSAANARSTQTRRYVLGRRVFATRVVILRPNAHQVLQYHLIIMRFFSSLVLFSSKNQRLEEEKRARVYSFFVRWYINCSASTHFAFFSVLLLWNWEKEKFGQILFFPLYVIHHLVHKAALCIKFGLYSKHLLACLLEKKKFFFAQFCFFFRSKRTEPLSSQFKRTHF